MQVVDLMLIGVPLSWALHVVGTKYVLDLGLVPQSYLAIRFTVAAVVFAFVALGIERTLRVAGRDRLWVGAAVILFAVNQIVFVFGLKYTTAVTVALITGLIPILVAFFSAAIGYEPLTRRVLLAGAISFGGVALVVAGIEGGLSEVSGEVLGIALAFATAVTYAAFTVAVAPPMRRYSPHRVSALVLLGTAAPLLLIGSPALAEQDYAAPGWLGWASVAFSTLIALVAAQVVWFAAIDRVGPARAGVFANIQPFAVVVFAALLLGEHLSVIQVAGGIAIGVGILVAHRRAGPVPPAE